MFKNMSVGKKLAFGFGLITVLFLLTFGYSTVKSIKQRDVLNKVNDTASLQNNISSVLNMINDARIQADTVIREIDHETYNNYLRTTNNISQLLADGAKNPDIAIEYRNEMESIAADLELWVNYVKNVQQYNLSLESKEEELGLLSQNLSSDVNELLFYATQNAGNSNLISKCIEMSEKLALMQQKSTEILLLYTTEDGNMKMLYSQIDELQQILKDISALSPAAVKPYVLNVEERLNAFYDKIILFAIESEESVTRCENPAFETEQKIAADVLKLSETAEFAVNAQIMNSITSNRINTIVIFVMSLITIVIGILASTKITNSIVLPLRRMQGLLVSVGETGRMNFDKNVLDSIEKDSEKPDEVGQSVKAFNTMLNRMLALSKCLSSVASGDLTADVATLSADDTMGNALHTMVAELNKIFIEIRDVGTQVATSSNEIAQGSQSLAQGSTQQSSTIQEISASVNEINGQMSISQQTSLESVKHGEEITGMAKEGNIKMEQMMAATQEINDASTAISHVIKVIDDIAFQTNILALNAAVEAARAGEHGKGFAVVAEEVRNLAGKSAEAAKETSQLISANIEKADLGLNISRETADNLSKIIEEIQLSGENIQKLAEQSQNAKLAIDQVNIAVEQVSMVVQQNSATSEESAAASQEMSSQAQVLQNLINKFKLKDENDFYENTLRLPPSESNNEPFVC